MPTLLHTEVLERMRSEEVKHCTALWKQNQGSVINMADDTGH
jgi:hypothetical protein